MNKLEAVLAKWEAKADYVLADDYATADICDWATASEIKRLVKEIRTTIKQGINK